MEYSLRDRVLFGVLALEEREANALVALFDAVVADPIGRAKAAFYDSAGRTGYVCVLGRFRLYYFVAKNGHVTLTDLRQDSLAG